MGGTPASNSDVMPAAEAFGSHPVSNDLIVSGEIGSIASTIPRTASTSRT